MKKGTWLAMGVALSVGMSACAVPEEEPDATSEKSETSEVSETEKKPEGKVDPKEVEVTDAASLREALGVDAVSFVEEKKYELATAEGSLSLDFAEDDFHSTIDGYPVNQTNGEILDISGEVVCEGQADALSVESVQKTAGGIVVVLQEQFTSGAQDIEPGDGKYELARTQKNCDTGETETLQSAVVEISSEGEKNLSSFFVGGKEFAVGTVVGDSPIELFDAEGNTIIGSDKGIFDFDFSADGKTVVFESYEEFVAYASPTSIGAVDATTGESKWEVEVPGFAHVAGDKVIVEVVEPGSLPTSDTGSFETIGLKVLDLETGEEIKDLSDVSFDIEFVQ